MKERHTKKSHGQEKSAWMDATRLDGYDMGLIVPILLGFDHIDRIVVPLARNDVFQM